jgi:hypothetical protein
MEDVGNMDKITARRTLILLAALVVCVLAFSLIKKLSGPLRTAPPGESVPPSAQTPVPPAQIAVPMPSSVKLSMEMMEENRPFTPSSSLPRVIINIFLDTNPMSTIKTWDIRPIMTLRKERFVLIYLPFPFRFMRMSDMFPPVMQDLSSAM